jgi:trehalose-phosphatase
MDKIETRAPSSPPALSSIFLFSDFDGTLAPIRKDPQKVVLSLRVRKALKNLAGQIPIAIISGRSIAFLQKTIAMPEILLAGNHGLEIETERVRYRHPQAVACKKTIKLFADHLKKAFRNTDGVLIEEKGLTATFHYRLVSPSKREAVCRAFYDYFKIFPNDGLLKVSTGKMSLEVRPNIDWGKKDAILWILGMYKKRFPERNVIPIYIGDDETDRSALALIKKIGISIFVGEEAATTIKATFFLPSQSKYIELLRRLQLELTDY